MAEQTKEPTMYFFDFDPAARLVVVTGDMPMEDAVATTGKTIKLFGWREGILRTIQEIERYLKTGQLEAHSERIRLNSRPKQMPNGDIFLACAACGYSPEADKAMWGSVVVALDQELENPPAV